MPLGDIIGSTWDGPFNLLDMLVIPEYLKPLVSDYRMNLIQVRQSENLCFQNQDISIVFDMIRSIYNKDYETFHEMYKDKTRIDSRFCSKVTGNYQ